MSDVRTLRLRENRPPDLRREHLRGGLAHGAEVIETLGAGSRLAVTSIREIARARRRVLDQTVSGLGRGGCQAALVSRCNGLIGLASAEIQRSHVGGVEIRFILSLIHI